MLAQGVRPLTDFLLLSATALVYIGTQITVGAFASTSNSPSVSPSTCPSQSVNYITQSLPQQCLASVRIGKAEESLASKVELEHTRTPKSLIEDQRRSTAVSTDSSKAFGQPTSTSTFTQTTDSETESHSSIDLSESPTTESSKDLHSPTSTDSENEGDSLFDNAKFLSFEEWKKQNLAKVGQSVENVGSGRVGSVDTRRRPGGINNALDSLGEDAEIEIDFGGFVNSETKAQQMASSGNIANREQSNKVRGKDDERLPERLSNAHTRSKDAGKTCKERSNYASFDCAATVLKTNSESKGATSVLIENKDSYMLNECAASNKFFIVELCDDILIDTVVLANYEFFSSIFRTFKVSVSDRYPVKMDKWRELGVFEARNTREVQAFLVEEPQIWARYLRIEFLTHFGNEYYCPISLLRVHGTTMMEEFNHELKSSRGEDDGEGSITEENEAQDAESPSTVVTAEILKEDAKPSATLTPNSTTGDSTLQAIQPTEMKDVDREGSNSDAHRENASAYEQTAFKLALSARLEELMTLDMNNAFCGLNDGPPDPPPTTSMTSAASSQTTTPAVSSSQQTNYPLSAPPSNDDTARTSILTKVSASDTQKSTTTESVEENVPSSKFTELVSQPAPKPHSSATHPPTPNPTTQESFFKSVHKRLQLLESNSTLSLQYIEEQSRILRDAFAKVEKRQLAKTTTFLETLNKTVLNEVREFRSQYDQIWQSTILELSAQRQQSQNEIGALSTRLSLLADELLFQKRIAILQFLLILLCLGLVLFSRGSSGVGYGYLEHMVQKSSVNLSRYAHFDSPLDGGSPSSTRPSSRYGIFSRASFHRSSPSEDSMVMSSSSTNNNNKGQGPDIAYSPPTPTSSQSAADGEGAELLLDDGPSSSKLKRRSDTSSGISAHLEPTTNGFLSPDEATDGSCRGDQSSDER
ncbi:MAG: hypothetical protein Q9190_006326 [Brigantiaea leucoxantha]